MEQYLNSSKLSPIEMAKHLISLKSFTNKKFDFDKVKEALVPHDKIGRVNQIIYGLEQEDEFAILCKLMGTCESLTKIGQNPLIQNNEIAPDLMGSFLPKSSVDKDKTDSFEYKCFIEVKSCKKKFFKISAKDLKRRVAFAERYKMPLIFAVRFTAFDSNGIWAIVDSINLFKNKRRIQISDILDGMKTVLLDDYGIYSDPHLHVAHYYDSNLQEGMKHKKYGVLVKTVILLPDQEPISIEGKNASLISFFIGMFDGEVAKVESENNITCEVVYIGSQLKILSDIMFQINRQVIDEDGNYDFDASKVMSLLDSKDGKYPLLTREMVEYSIFYLNSKYPMFHPMGLGEEKNRKSMLRNLDMDNHH